MIKELVQFIENGTDLIVGTNLFAGFAPPTVEDCVIVIESGGVPNFFVKDFVEKAIQVLSRSRNYWTAKSNADKVYELLHTQAGITLPVVEVGKEYYANTIEAVSAPQSLGQDDKGLFNISTNYVLKIQDA